MPKFKRICFIVPLLYLLMEIYLLGLSSPPLCMVSESAWVDGTCDLIVRANRVIRVAEGVRRAPTAQFAPQLGEQRKFYAVDFARSGSPYFTTATCRAVGKFCYIFVEDSQWQRGSVTTTGVARLKRAFDESTPANALKGIYELETASFGSPPDEIDLDPKIYVLILDIPDSHSGTGNFVAGYFEPINQKRGVLRDPDTGMQFNSNEVEMLYIDADPLNTDDVTAREVLAHEFQHLIHWRHDPNEDIWINEGCSDYAALFLCGYGSGRHSWHVDAFEQEPQTSLVYWPYGMMSPLASYGAVYLWIMYLHEHYGGVSTISSLIAQPANGIAGINAVLSSRGYSERFKDVFSDWKIANYLDDTSFESGRYGYSSVDLKAKHRSRHSSFPVSGASNYMQSWAADYIEFVSGDKISDLQIDFTVRNPSYDFDVRAIVMRNGLPLAVESVQVQSGSGHISIPKFGFTADTVILVPNWQPRTEVDFDGIASCSYSARLGGEIRCKVTFLPNAVNKRYVDIVAQLSETVSDDIPKITITRLGKTLVNAQNMISVSQLERKGILYVYQLYIPDGWNGSEIRWDISYLGRSVVSGDLEGLFGH